MAEYKSVLEMLEDISDPETIEKFKKEIDRIKIDLFHEIFCEWAKSKFHMQSAERLIKKKIRSALDVVFVNNENLDSITVKLIPAKSKFSTKMDFCLNSVGDLTHSSKQIAKLLQKDFANETHEIALEVCKSNFIEVRRSDLRI